MIVVEDQAEVKLIERLELLREHSRLTRCLDMRFSRIEPELRLGRKALVELIQSVFPDEKQTAQIYFLMDDDAVVLLDLVAAKQMRQLAALLPAGADHYLKLHEFQHQLNQVIMHAQAKLDALHARRESAKLREQQALLAKRRQQILSYTVSEMDQSRITTARSKRNQRELMIVEDDVFSRRLLENILPKQYHTTAVGDPEAALERYILLVPDVLFLDIDLPDVNGHELLQKILAIDPSAYVIMISGNSDKDNVIRAMSHGARGFIAKPFARERIHDYIQRCPTINNELPHAHS